MASLPRSHRIVGRWVPSAGATGFRLIDRSGRSNHGVLTNMDPASDWLASGGKLALDLDGSNDYLNLSSARRLYPNLTQASFSGWFNFRTFSNAYIQLLETQVSSGINYHLSCLVKSNGKLAFYVSDGASQTFYDGTGAFTLSANTWYHLCYVYRGGVRQQAYVNGVLDGSAASIVSTLVASDDQVNISRSSFGTRFFDGRMDDCAIYNTALTDNEIREIYRLGRGYGVFPEPDFDEGFAAAGFKAYWARRQSQLIGGGV